MYKTWYVIRKVTKIEGQLVLMTIIVCFYSFFFLFPFFYILFLFFFFNTFIIFLTLLWPSFVIFFRMVVILTLLFWPFIQLLIFFFQPLRVRIGTTEHYRSNSPLYGLTFYYNYVDRGPRSQGPHAPRIILGPFGMTPRAPKPLQVQIKVQY